MAKGAWNALALRYGTEAVPGTCAVRRVMDAYRRMEDVWTRNFNWNKYTGSSASRTWPGAGEEREGRRAMVECGTHVSTEPYVCNAYSGFGIRASARKEDIREACLKRHARWSVRCQRARERDDTPFSLRSVFTAAPRIASHC